MLPATDKNCSVFYLHWCLYSVLAEIMDSNICIMFNLYSGTCLNGTSLGPAFVLGIDRVRFIQVKKTEISYIVTLFS